MDYGLLGALGEGLKQGVSSYSDAKKLKQDRELQLQKQAMDKKLYQASLADKGLQELPGEGEEVSFEETPLAKQKREFDQEYKRGLIGYREERDRKKDERDAVAAGMSLRKEKENQPVVKNFNLLSEAYGKIAQTAAIPEKDPARPQADMSLIYGFMKIQDPNSTVREGEYASAENTRGVPDTVRALYNKAKDGEKLSQQQRAGFISQAKAIYESQKKLKKQVDARYSNLATKSGVDPEYIKSDLEVEEVAPSRGLINRSGGPTREQKIKMLRGG